MYFVRKVIHVGLVGCGLYAMWLASDRPGTEMAFPAFAFGSALWLTVKH